MKYTLSIDGINRLKRDVIGKQKWLQERTHELARRLAEIGVEQARISFALAPYDGIKEFDVEPLPNGDARFIVRATGDSVLFIEFGVGNIGHGHPEAADNMMGPGTYPGQTHVPVPGWWYLPKEIQETTGKETSIGNPASMPMYNAVKYLEQHLEQIAREVFAE